MGFFGIDTYRELSFIPPDPPEREPIVERNGRVTRTTYPEGEVSWDVRGLNHSESSVLSGMRDEALEHAYELGQMSMEEENRRLRAHLQEALQDLEHAWGAGVLVAAQTAYGGRR